MVLKRNTKTPMIPVEKHVRPCAADFRFFVQSGKSLCLLAGSHVRCDAKRTFLSALCACYAGKIERNLRSCGDTGIALQYDNGQTARGTNRLCEDETARTYHISMISATEMIKIGTDTVIFSTFAAEMPQPVGCAKTKTTAKIKFVVVQDSPWFYTYEFCKSTPYAKELPCGESLQSLETADLRKLKLCQCALVTKKTLWSNQDTLWVESS